MSRSSSKLSLLMGSSSGEGTIPPPFSSPEEEEDPSLLSGQHDSVSPQAIQAALNLLQSLHHQMLYDDSPPANERSTVHDKEDDDDDDDDDADTESTAAKAGGGVSPLTAASSYTATKLPGSQQAQTQTSTASTVTVTVTVTVTGLPENNVRASDKKQSKPSDRLVDSTQINLVPVTPETQDLTHEKDSVTPYSAVAVTVVEVNSLQNGEASPRPAARPAIMPPPSFMKPLFQHPHKVRSCKPINASVQKMGNEVLAKYIWDTCASVVVADSYSTSTAHHNGDVVQTDANGDPHDIDEYPSFESWNSTSCCNPKNLTFEAEEEDGKSTTDFLKALIPSPTNEDTTKSDRTGGTQHHDEMEETIGVEKDAILYEGNENEQHGSSSSDDDDEEDSDESDNDKEEPADEEHEEDDDFVATIQANDGTSFLQLRIEPSTTNTHHVGDKSNPLVGEHTTPATSSSSSKVQLSPLSSSHVSPKSHQQHHDVPKKSGPTLQM